MFAGAALSTLKAALLACSLSVAEIPTYLFS